jgi:hypothetical protein
MQSITNNMNSNLNKCQKISMDVVSFSGQLLHEEQIVVNPFAFKVLLISS